MIEKRRFGRAMKLPSTVSIKHQILVRMLHEAMERERLEAESGDARPLARRETAQPQSLLT
jgi:hypothetical protein